MTHTSYELSKKLKEFLGKDAPEPIAKSWSKYCPVCGLMEFESDHDCVCSTIPAYTLEDLLSKPFCEAFGKKLGPDEWPITYDEPERIARWIQRRYWNGGYPEVEKCLLEMMK